MRFDEFMRRALYDPVEGYYRKPLADLFGRSGDFFTASQIQPLFGRIIAAELRRLLPGAPVFEMGPGRGEMAAFLGPNYKGIEVGQELPTDLSGIVFANEFFDAVPVRLVRMRSGVCRELLVQERQLVDGPEIESGCAEYVSRYWPYLGEGGRAEIALESLEWIDRLAERMRFGYVLIIDYGYTTRETIRFPHGTVMSYRNHVAVEDVCGAPGLQDITAHVPFDALTDRARVRGFSVHPLETLASLVLRNLEVHPEFLSSEPDRLQLKTLLLGMGETFRCLLLSKPRAEVS